MSHKEIHVSIGEVKLGKGTDILKSSLGSCVGIALFWKNKKRFALAHCLLAEATTQSFNIDARYVSQAVPSLISLMQIKTIEDFKEIEAVIAGGGNMTAAKVTKDENLVGYLNIRATEKYLNKYGIKIIYRDVGGKNGRKIQIFCETAEYKIDIIPRINKAV